MQVPALRTPLSRDSTAQAIVPAFVRVFGAAPDRNTAELLLAQVWLENAHGQSIIARNIGNLTSSGNDGDFWRPPWFDRAEVDELPDADPNKARFLLLNDRMQRGEAPKAFRAFDSFDQGFEAWLRLLGSPSKRAILAAASSGDAERFARAIFETGYCPDPECRSAGASYRKLQAEIRGAAYFDDLQKKKQEAETQLGLWFWCWGRLLSQRLSTSSESTRRAAALLLRELEQRGRP